MADAVGQAAWDGGAAPRRGGRRLVAAAVLGLAALLLLGAFVVSRSGPDGDVLALGPATDGNDLPPVDDPGLFIDGAGLGGQSQLAPGDSIPSVPAGGDPAAVAAGGATDGGGTLGAAGGDTTAAGATAGSGGAAVGTPGPGPGQGIPTPTTRPGSTGTPTTAGPGTTAPPQCAISEVAVNPPVLGRHRSEKLYGDPEVTFRPADCGPGEFRVRANGLDVPSSATGDGSYIATIPGNAAKWTANDRHEITVIHIPTGVTGFGYLKVT